MNKNILILISILVSLWLIPVTRVEAQCTVRADWTGTYTVVSGDNLYRIALKYGTTTTVLAQGNCISNVNSIYAGQVLRVPSGTVPSGNNCTQYLASRLTYNGQGRVLAGVPNNVRASASTTATLVGQLAGGSVFKITGNPQCAEGILWWPINANGVIGWTGELQGTSYWVEPFSGAITGTTAVINTYVLNVRNAASIQGAILTRVRRGEAYTISQWSADSRWIQINVNGIIGWVRASYVTVI